ncbi:iron chaperone [Parabacteroides sp. FAFU027]|uniref:iron chaperone n=1 Tax=Parabacteroides sp. FAFU027 TaxID=2922715 RepID=UPI001FB00C4D|nr:DUF1801 domain-containing protein [Parabacteroides sp. FAFU027]
MKPENNIPTTIDEYIATFPDAIQELLNQMRAAIREAAPEATEKISYQMPAFAQQGILVYFAAFSKHIGFYPTSSAMEAFSEELSVYKNGKGSVQFPIHQPLPLDLVKQMVQFRVAENLEKAAVKSIKKNK